MKNNQELDRQAPEIARLHSAVMNSLVQHPDYRARALAVRVAAPFYARYTPGMRYGDHVDDAIMGGENGLHRIDIAITVFLNDPQSYDGGELVIQREEMSDLWMREWE